MQKLTVLVLFSLILTTSAGQSNPYDTIQYAKDYYQQRVAVFNKEPVKKNEIIFLGNSITEFGDWTNLLQDPGVINRGIAADNTHGVLARLEDVIIRQPKKIFVEIGINDIAQHIPGPIILKNILSLVERVHAKSPETRIYLISILPVNDQVIKEYPNLFHKNEQINSIDSLLAKNARDNKYTYVDLNRKLKNKKGNLDSRYAKPDGLHLNRDGYRIWISFLRAKKYL